jgi:hypothetical protein
MAFGQGNVRGGFIVRNDSIRPGSNAKITWWIEASSSRVDVGE